MRSITCLSSFISRCKFLYYTFIILAASFPFQAAVILIYIHLGRVYNSLFYSSSSFYSLALTYRPVDRSRRLIRPIKAIITFISLVLTQGWIFPFQPYNPLLKAYGSIQIPFILSVPSFSSSIFIYLPALSSWLDDIIFSFTTCDPFFGSYHILFPFFF